MRKRARLRVKRQPAMPALREQDLSNAHAIQRNARLPCDVAAIARRPCARLKYRHTIKRSQVRAQLSTGLLQGRFTMGFKRCR